MSKTKYRVISIDIVMSKLRNSVVWILDRYEQDFFPVAALSLAEWIDICDHDNSDNRFEFYIEEETED